MSTATVVLELKDLVSPGLKGPQDNIKAFGNVATGAFIGLGAVAAAGLGAAVKAAMGFEKELSNLGSVSGATAEQMGLINDKALQLGKDTAFSAGESAMAMTELAKAGMSIPDILGGAADATVSLAAAGDIALADAATIASTVKNSFQMTAEEMPKIADVVAGFANASSASVSDFSESIKAVGPTAGMLKVPLGDTAAALGVMAKYGHLGAEAGNSMKRMLLSLAAPSDKAAGVIKELGLKVFDASGKMRPMREVADELQRATAGLTDKAKAAALSDIFGTFGLSAAADLAKGGAAAFDEMNVAMGQTAAADVAAAKLNNLSGDLEQLKGSVETTLIALGQGFLPIARALAQGATGVVNAMLPVAEAFTARLPDALNRVGLAVSPVLAVLIVLKDGLLSLVQANPVPWIAGIATALTVLLVPALGLVATTIWAMVGPAILGMVAVLGPVVPLALGLGLVVGILMTNFMGLRDMLVNGVNMALAFLQQNFMMLMPLLALVGLTILTQFVIPLAVSAVQAVGSFVLSLLLAIPQLLIFSAQMLFGGVVTVASWVLGMASAAASAVVFAATLTGQVISAVATTAATFLTTLVPAAVTAGVTLLTSTVPAVLTTANTFLVNLITAVAGGAAALVTTLIPAAAATAVTFLTTTVPAAIAAGVAFLTSTVPAALAAAAAFLGGLIPAAIGVAVTFLTVTVPAAISVGIAFLGMLATGLVAFASLVVSAIVTGIGIVIAFLPIILIAVAIGVAVYLLYKNWSTVWAWIVKVTSGAAQKITSWLGKAISWVAGIVKKGLAFVWDLFKRVFNSVVGAASKFGSFLYSTVVKAIGAMADKVSDIIGRLAEWIGDAFAQIVQFVANAISNLPGASKVIALLGGLGAGISNTLKGLKKRFTEGGEDGGKSFMGGIQDVMSGEMSFTDFVMDAMGMEGIGDLATGGEAAGGAGGAGAAAKDPLGIWEGTDSKGHWVIDPATGKKVYDAGSVGATGQEANAAKAAESAAKAQAKSASKSGLGTAAGKAGAETMDLAKAFSEAISEAVTTMQELVGANLPEAALYQPQLDRIKLFFLAVGQMFKDLVANATDSTTVRFEGALDKNDLKRITKWADPFTLVLDTMDKGIEVMVKLNDLKIPDLTILDSVKDFLLKAGDVASDVSAQLDATALTALAPMTEGFQKWMDVLAKAATVATQLQTTKFGPELAGAVEAVAAFLGDVAVRTGSMVSGAMRALGDGLQEALFASQSLATTFGAWMDTLGKVGAAATSMTTVVITPNQIAAVGDFLMGVAMLTGSFVDGMGRAYAPEARKLVLELSRDLASTFAAWFDALAKLGTAATALADSKPIPDGTLKKIEDLLREVAWITHRLLVGDGYDLTKNPEKSAKDFAVARDLFATLSAGLDALSKAGGMDLSKAARVTADQLSIAAENCRDALAMMVRLAGMWGSMAPEMRADVFKRVQEYAAIVGPVVDALSKAANLGLDKAVRANADSLAVAERNAADAVAVVMRLAGGWAFLTAAFRDEVFAQMKAYADLVGPAVDVISKAANLGLDEAVRGTAGQLAVAEANAVDAVAAVMRLANAWASMEKTARADLFARVTEYADMVGPVVDAISAAANLGLDQAIAATSEGLTIAQDNAQQAVRVMVQLTAGWLLMEDEARSRLFTAIQAYADTAGAAVEAVSSAAGLGEAMAGATSILPERLTVVQDNIQLAVALMTKLALGWRILEDETRTKLFAEIEAYADTAGKAVDAVVNAASIGKDVADMTAVPAATWRIIEENLTNSVFTLLGVVRSVGTAGMAEARAAAESAAPVLDVIGKALEIFTLEKIMASPFVAKYKAFSAKDPNAYAKGIAANLQAGIVLMFTTLQNALLQIGPVPSEIGAYATALFAAYAPLLDLVEKVNGLTIDLDKISQLAQIPGILGAGLGMQPPPAGGGGGAGGMGSLGGLLGNGPITLTGPVTAMGPMYFQGTQTVEVSIDGETIQRTTRSGYFQSARQQEGRGAQPA